MYLGSPAHFDEEAIRNEKEHIKLFRLADLFWGKGLCLFVSFITAKWFWKSHICTTFYSVHLTMLTDELILGIRLEIILRWLSILSTKKV